jgi:tetratricopeptide (TPR) repeat protein
MSEETKQSEEEAKEKEKTQAEKDYDEAKERLKDKDVAQAANLFHNALLGFEEENNENGVANSLDQLGDICFERGDFDKAEAHYQKAYAIVEKVVDRFSLLSLNKKLAKTSHQKKDYDKAISLYLDLLDEYSALNNPQGSVNTFEIMSAIFLEKGDKAGAIDALKTAASIHAGFGHKKDYQELLDKAAKIQ